VQLFSPCLYFVPRCVLNCIIVNGASHLTEFSEVKWLWKQYRTTGGRHRTDLIVWLVACGCTIAFGAFKGILTAVIVSLVLILQQIVNPSIVRLAWKDDNKTWVNAALHPEAHDKPHVLVIRFEGPIFYANVERFQEWLEEQEVEAEEAGCEIRAIVLSASAVPFVDTTAIQALRSMLEAYKKRGVTFLIANGFGQAGRTFQHLLGHLLPRESLERFCDVSACIELIEQQGERPERTPLRGSMVVSRSDRRFISGVQ